MADLSTAQRSRRLAEESDPPGLVWGFHFHGDGRSHAIGAAGVTEALATGAGWIWLHINIADVRARQWLETSAPIGVAGRDLLLDDDDHLSLTAEDGALMGVFADFKREFDHGTQDIARLRFVLEGNRLITVRRHALSAIEEARRQVIAGQEFESGELLLEAIFETFAAQVGAMAKELSATLEKFEDRIVDDTVSDKDVKLGPVRRTALRLNRQLSALRLHFSAFVASEDRSVPDDVYAMVERIALRLDTVGRDIEAIQERARILQEEMSTKLANETNRQITALSIMTALFLPATLVSGLFGMNTHGLPFDNSETGFWLALGVGALGSGAVYLFLRKMGIGR